MADRDATAREAREAIRRGERCRMNDCPNAPKLAAAQAQHEYAVKELRSYVAANATFKRWERDLAAALAREQTLREALTDIADHRNKAQTIGDPCDEDCVIEICDSALAALAATETETG